MKKYCLTLGALLQLSLAACSQPVDFQKEFPDRNLLDWKPGMRFQVQAAGVGFGCPLLALKGPTFKGTDLYTRSANSYNDKQLAGQVLTFQRVEAFTDRGYNGQNTGSGTDQVAVVFKAPNGKQYAHVISTPLATLRKLNTTVGAPCMVLLDEVDKARQVLVGKKFFVLEQYIAANSTREDVKYLPRYVPVKITKAAAGTGRLPVRLTFEYVGTGQVQEHDYVLSGTNASRTFNTGELLPESFQHSFGAADPRVAHQIKETYWKAIQQGILVKGMSMKEVELAMGKPRQKTESMDEERLTAWYYSRFQGKEWELLFRNGLLERYINNQE